jgi:hypothetical protein
MKNLTLSLLLVCFASHLFAQENYAASQILPTLLRNANIVVRQYDATLTIKNKAEATYTEHKVITLLNDGASKSNTEVFYYDDLQNIEDLEAAVYDGYGTLVRKIKKKDIKDLKPFEKFVNDGRCKIIEFPRLVYPYTIEYTITWQFNGIFQFPMFAPQTDAKESIQHARFSVETPSGYNIRAKEYFVPAACKTGKYQWTFTNVPPLSNEPFMISSELPLPRIILAPSQFSIEGYEGEMSEWKTFGQFINTLNKGRDNVPEATVQKIQQLTADCTDDVCKVERVFGYLQESTRYFYIGLGIGGWQPMEAKDVDNYKYGDCKALSNYTVALLGAVGVKAHYCLVLALPHKQHGLDTSFPSNHFNHAFVCVPLANDTIWLECTSQTISCGYLGDHTDNRPVCLISDKGGTIVRTPVYDETKNTTVQHTTLTLATDGSAMLHSDDVYRCLSMDELGWTESSAEARKKALYASVALSDFEISRDTIVLKKGRFPELRHELDLTVFKYAAASGKRLFVPAVALAPKVSIPAMDSVRRYSVQATSRGYTQENHLIIKVPEGFSLENGIEPIEYNSVFGHYRLDITNEPGQLVVHRKLVMNNSLQSKDKYTEFVNFCKNISKADKTKLVLAKGT